MSDYPSPTLARVTSMPARILIVDDDEMLRELYEAILIGAGYQTESAKDADEALALLGLGDFDLVLTDYHMPRLGGAGLVHAMRSTGQNIPVIIVSGSLQNLSDLPAEVRDAITDALPKPVSAETMLDAVRRALAGARQVTASAMASN